VSQVTEKKDIRDMVEMITLAIVHLQTEEHFFQRSGEQSTDEASKKLFTEIAEEISKSRKNLEAKQQQLMHMLMSPATYPE
jgi:hypothetical protein